MQKLQTAAVGISRVGAIVGGAMLLVASILICIDITLRYTVSTTLGGSRRANGPDLDRRCAGLQHRQPRSPGMAAPV